MNIIICVLILVFGWAGSFYCDVYGIVEHPALFWVMGWLGGFWGTMFLNKGE